MVLKLIQQEENLRNEISYIEITTKDGNISSFHEDITDDEILFYFAEDESLTIVSKRHKLMDQISKDWLMRVKVAFKEGGEISDVIDHFE